MRKLWLLLVLFWQASAAQAQSLNAYEQSLASFVNVGRAEQGRAQLRLSASLTAQAQARARQVVASGNLSALDGELITGGYFSGFQTYQQLAADLDKRARLMDCNAASLGVGFAYAPSSPLRYYWVIVFSILPEGDFFPPLSASLNANEIAVNARTGLSLPGVLLLRYVGSSQTYLQTEHRIPATGVRLLFQYSKEESFKLVVGLAQKMTAADRADLIRQLQGIP